MSKTKNSKKLLRKRKKKTPSILNIPKATVICANINGRPDNATRISGWTFDELLNNCTQTLKMTSAARKLYLANGVLVESIDQLKCHPEVFVSQGEPFIDTMKLHKATVAAREMSFWGLNGVYLPKSKPKRPKTPKGSEPTRISYRILTFPNGKYHLDDAYEVISDLKSMEEFKALCDAKHSINGQCKRIFSVNYHEFKDIEEMLNEKSYVWDPTGKSAVLGPVWASTKEDLDRSAVNEYFKMVHTNIRVLLKKERRHLAELDAMTNGDVDKVHTSSIKSYSKKELEMRKIESEQKVDKLDDECERFKHRLNFKPENVTEVTKTSYNKDRFKTTPGLRLKVYTNGHPKMKKVIFFFNEEQANKGINNDHHLLFVRLLDDLSKNIHLTESNDHSKGILIRRLFTEEGTEIFDVKSLKYDQTVYVSHGEDWIDPKCLCLSGKIHFMDENLRESSGDVNDLRNYVLSKKREERDLVYNLPVLQDKRKSSSYLMVSVSVLDRDPKSFIKDNWSLTKNGQIFLKSIPSLSLTLLPKVKRSVQLQDSIDKSSRDTVTCYSVQLCPSESGDQYQSWIFTKSGQFCSKADSSLYLTYMPMKAVVSQNTFLDVVKNCNVCASELLPHHLGGYQRWGFRDINQRKSCDQPNAEWYKAELIWPLKDDDSLNDDLNWPISGLLMTRVPLVTRNDVNSKPRFPIKLNVLKNNDHNNMKEVLVTGPDLTKFVRVRRDDKYETHCSNESLLRMEFDMFLSICTSTFCLPSAARRLFNEDGRELVILEGLSNFDKVFISMGEMWCSQESSLSKIRLRAYAAKLAIDVERIGNFIQLQRTVADFVLGIKDAVLGESVVEVQEVSEQSRKELQRISDEDNHVPIVEEPREPSEDESSRYRTSHEKNCDAARMQFARKADIGQSANMAEVASTAERREHSETIPSLNLQQFVLENDRIVTTSNKKYCLCANDPGGHVTFKKVPPSTDGSQYKWIVHKSKIIESAHHRGYVLATSCPRMLPFQDKSNGSHSGLLISLEKAGNTKYGNAFQRFNIESRSGLIYPFFSNKLDKGVTSAIYSSICTRFVCSKAINQQGFLVDMTGDNSTGDKNGPICVSCASTLNGKFTVTPLRDYRRTFVCSFAGGFKVIRGADLSSENAEETYRFYVAKLHDIREQLRIKPCKNMITSAPIRRIKILLYKNGCGRLNAPLVATGKSILQIIESAAYLLNLQRPVRILYTESGVAITDELSFVNAMAGCRVEDNTVETTELEEDKEIHDSDLGEDDASLQINLSGDGSFFTVASRHSVPRNLYSIEICISKLDGMEEFCDDSVQSDVVYLINYEIFKNQINTDLFRGDDDFESESSDLTVKSSPRALERLFTEDLKVLRLQLVAAIIEDTPTLSDNVRLDIKSIDAIADVNLQIIAAKMSNVDTKSVTEIFVCPLISAETFSRTKASVTVEVSVKTLGDSAAQKSDELTSMDSESIIMQPSYLTDDHPVELWASTGEPFQLPIEDSSGKSACLKKIDQLKSDISNKKFLLRNIKGERIKRLNAGTLEATGDGKNPVMIKGNWMFPSKHEIELQNQIAVQEEELARRRARPHRATASAVSGSLYEQKHMRNCLVYQNGDNKNNAVSAWGESLYDIMKCAAGLLQMKKTPRFLFRENGDQVKSIEEVTPGLRLALSHHSTFISAQDTRLNCEIKANWGRARSTHGEQSTELQIQHRPITVIDVDPFDPPDIMKPRDSISKDFKTFKVFENGQSPSGASTITGNSLPDLLRKAAKVLDLAAAVKCFYTLDGTRIISFKEILNDDVLAASVAARGFISSSSDA